MTSGTVISHTIGMTNVIICARFSSTQQERGSSIERQLELARAHIARMGWTEVEVVMDKGRSAWKGDHLSKGNLGALTHRIKAGAVPRGTVILVEKLDRLSRQERRRAQRWLEDVTDCGIGVATVDGARLYTADTLRENMMEVIEILMRAELAWKESEQKSERIMDAQARKRAKAAETGAVMSSRCPGWLKVEGDRFVIDEGRADIVRQIFQWTADGVGARTIGKKLNDAGVPTWGRGAGWEPTYIGEIIASPAVEGDHQPTRQINGRKTPTFDRIIGYYPRIVPADLVAAARSARRSRTNRKTGGPYKHSAANLWSGLIRCAHCLSPMTLRNGPTERASMGCSNAYRGRGCTQVGSLRYRAFEKAALDTMLDLALDDTYFAQPDQRVRLQARVAELEKLIADQETKATRLLNLILATDDPDPGLVQSRADLARLIAQTKARLVDARTDLESALGAIDPIQHMKRVNEVRALLDHADPDVRFEARQKVKTALRGVVSMVLCDLTDDHRGRPEKTYTLALLNGVRAWKFTHTGELIGEVDLSDAIADRERNAALHQGLTGGDPANVARLDAYLARRAKVMAA